MHRAAPCLRPRTRRTCSTSSIPRTKDDCRVRAFGRWPTIEYGCEKKLKSRLSATFSLHSKQPRATCPVTMRIAHRSLQDARGEEPLPSRTANFVYHTCGNAEWCATSLLIFTISINTVALASAILAMILTHQENARLASNTSQVIIASCMLIHSMISLNNTFGGLRMDRA